MINISGEKILIADEDRRFRQLISSNLKSLGYDVIEADNGDDALKKAIYLQPDLLLIDLLSPEINGLEVCKDIRSTKDVAYMPIIILTAISDEFDIVLGLELGADDLIKKPFSMRELYARVKAVLRRSDFKPIHNVVVIKDLVVNFEKYQVTKAGKKVDFTLKEFEVLELLIKSSPKPLSRGYILGKIWGGGHISDDRTVDVHIRNLRKKIETNNKNPLFIETVRGIGYRFNLE